MAQETRLSRRPYIVSSAGGAILGILATSAFAGHPMLSEDTGTQGKNNWELELGYAWIEAGADRVFLFQPQLSYGASPTLDFIVQPSWTTFEGTPGGRVRGLGDTNLDAKCRFYGAAPWSIGIRAGLGVPTSQHGLGLPNGNVSPHAILVATADLTPFAFDLNLGYSYVPGDPRQRPDLYHFSAAATYTANERLFLVLDAAADSNPDSTPGCSTESY